MLSEKFNYPPFIDKIIDEFKSTCENVLGKENTGILLVGSCPRGELAMGERESRPQLFSDIEFIIAVETRNRSNELKLAELVAAIEKNWNLGERFSLDYDIMTWEKIKNCEKRIIIFDSKNTGIDLTNHRVVPELPLVTIKNLNFQELNDVLLHRVKALIVDAPQALSPSVDQRDQFLYSIAKNALDITTWLFPYESIGLVSGFGNRLQYWQENLPDLQLGRYFGEEELLFLRTCLDIRQGQHQSANTARLLTQLLSSYRKAIVYCLNMNGVSGEKQLSNHLVSRKIFWEYRWKRRLMELFLILKNRNLFNPRTFFKNIFLPRKGRQIVFCLGMIEALLMILENDKELQLQLDKCEGLLGNLRAVTFNTLTDPVDRWKKIRDQYLSLNRVFI